MSAAVNNGLAAGVYYGFSVVFPQVVNILYRGRGEISAYDVGTQAGLAPMAFVFAQVCHGFLEWVTGPKWGMIGAATVGCAILTACSTDLNNRSLTEGLLIVGCFAMGLVESLATTTATFPLRSQEEIGQGGGLTGSMRNFVSAIALAVYNATLSNRLSVTVGQRVTPIAVAQGFPVDQIPMLTTVLQGTAQANTVPA